MEAVQFLVDYLDTYKKHPAFIEQFDSHQKPSETRIEDQVPLPLFARLKIAIFKKMMIHKKEIENKNKTTDNKKTVKQRRKTEPSQ